MIFKNDRIIEVVKLKDLCVPENLQRDVRLSKIDKIIKNFDIRSVGRVLCNYRDGKYFIIDGQHRAIALSKLKYKAIECDVYMDLTEKEEATLYTHLANTTHHSVYEKFKAELVKGDPLSLEINKLFNSLGIEIGSHRNAKKISCIKDIMFCYKKNKDVLIETVELFKECFDLKKGITGVELKGMFIFLEKALRDHKFNKRFFIKRLSTIPQSKILKLGVENKHSLSTTPCKGYAVSLLVTYNSKKLDANRMSLDLLN